MRKLIILFAALFVLFGCSRVTPYEVISLDQVPENIRHSIKDTPGGSTGMAEIGDEAYAIIAGEVGQEVEVVKVEDFDVHYRIIESADPQSERPIKVVKLENNGAPVGFMKVE